MTTGMGLVFAVMAVLVVVCFGGSYWLAERVASWFAVYILGGTAVFHGHIFAVRGSSYVRQITFVKKAKKTTTRDVQTLVLGLVYHGIAFALFLFVLGRLIPLFAQFIIPFMLGQT
jgi:hypothetical protein